MGVVYRARDEKLSRDVAIKMIVPGSSLSATARHRARNEAQALSRLSHPNIETVFEFDSYEGRDFLVVELIPGTSLDDLLSSGPLPPEQTLSLFLQLLRGLSAAHERGVIHRDLKPANLRLTPDGFLKILDFGLARLKEEDAQKHEFTTETQNSAFSGTLSYMSPEQLRGSVPDVRSDIYSAGLVLYQICTGRLPFRESGALLIDAILNRPIPAPHTFNKDLDEQIEAVILKSLQKDPKLRYQSAGEMLADLEACSLKGAASANKPKFWLRLAMAPTVVVAIAVASWLEHVPIARWINQQLHPEPASKYVAVMPFTSAPNDDPAFDQGLTDAVATKLMEITSAQPVQVVSPRELRSEKVADVADARKKLGVNLVVEGSRQQTEGATRVSLGLVDATTSRLLRASNFTVNTNDTFALQDQVIDKVVQMLEIEIHKGLGGQGHGTTSSTAFKDYTRGVGFLHNHINPEDIDAAIDQFSQALAIDPGYSAAQASIGMAYLQKYQDTKDPIWINRTSTACEQSSVVDSRLPEASLCLGALQLATGEYEQAVSSFRSVTEEDPSNEDAYGQLAVAYERLGRISQAEQTYRQAISALPNYAVSHDLLARFYSHRARYSEAAEELKKAIALAPQVAGYWASLGGVYYLSGDYQEALTALQRAVELRPSYSAYNNLGASYFALRRYSEAIAAFQQMVTLMPRQIQAHGNLARAYYWDSPAKRNLARTEYLLALDLADQELKVNPRDADTHLLAALYCAMLGRNHEANQHLDFALRASPNDAETLYFAAIICNQLGEREEAGQWLQKAISNGYSRAEIARTPELAGIGPPLK